MFTGIIKTTGLIKKKEESGRNIMLGIRPADETFLSDVGEGASISVNGVCLTVTAVDKGSFSAFIAAETYNITNLRDIHSNDPVNLEKALKINDRLDGHIVMGHVDDTGIVTSIRKLHEDYKLEIKIPPGLTKYVIKKGSITLNGISLTVADIRSNLLSFSIIPSTYKKTNIPQMKSGKKVNIEVDMFAKYAEKLQK